MFGHFRLNYAGDFDGVTLLIECRLPTFPSERSEMEYFPGASFFPLHRALYGSEKARSYRVTLPFLSALLGCGICSVFGESK